MVAPLSFKSQLGYCNLRVNPTFDEVLGTIRKPLRVPIPDRKAKWYANSLYRSLILDAEKKYQDYEHASIDYKQSGAELPETAARVRPSDAGDDETFHELDQHHHRIEQQNAYEQAFDLMNQEHQRQTEETRREQLRLTYGANRMHPVIEAHHGELMEAEVGHHMPAPREPVPRRVWHTPNEQYTAYGQRQAPEFPSFERLNMGQSADVRQASMSFDQNMTYERIREFTVQPTW